MADETTLEVVTNTTANSCVKVNCSCQTMWSLVQQMSYMRLCDMSTELKGTMQLDYVARARRIAATYARFYLEKEEGCDPALKGRFYWMALGAFASKTVACSFEMYRIRALGLISDSVYEGLGQGNFWLYMDISAWHWYYTKYNTTFEQCLGSRNATTYSTEVKARVQQLRWSADSLPKINNMQVTAPLKEGFELVRQIEPLLRSGKNETTRRKTQLAHLIAIAKHEQGEILQPLIYENPSFKGWVQRQRNFSWFSPDLELVFSHQCSTKDPELKSVAPDETRLENLTSRMHWITQAAKKFHNLMGNKEEYMERELRTIAGWVKWTDPNKTALSDDIHKWNSLKDAASMTGNWASGRGPDDTEFGPGSPQVHRYLHKFSSPVNKQNCYVLTDA
jgi:hypothetical protein